MIIIVILIYDFATVSLGGAVVNLNSNTFVFCWLRANGFGRCYVALLRIGAALAIVSITITVRVSLVMNER